MCKVLNRAFATSQRRVMSFVATSLVGIGCSRLVGRRGMPMVHESGLVSIFLLVCVDNRPSDVGSQAAADPVLGIFIARNVS